MFRQITPSQIPRNVFDLIGKRWFLLTAGAETYNTMTASWGGFVRIWNADCVAVTVRPQRHTFSFMEANDTFTLSFFDELYRPALSFCGSHSGRNCDKASETGLIPVSDDECTYFEQADLVLFCKKIYTSDVRPENFTNRSVVEDFYPASDFHRLYVGKIEKVLFKD